MVYGKVEFLPRIPFSRNSLFRPIRRVMILSLKRKEGKTMRKLIFLFFGALILSACALPQQQRVIHPNGKEVDCKVYQNGAGGVATYQVKSGR
jgi:hypothetical protein